MVCGKKGEVREGGGKGKVQKCSRGRHGRAGVWQRHAGRWCGMQALSGDIIMSLLGKEGRRSNLLPSNDFIAAGIQEVLCREEKAVCREKQGTNRQRGV